MVDPIWFASRIQELALVLESLWWLLGAVVRFNSGVRQRVKGQDFQKNIASAMAYAPEIIDNLQTLSDIKKSESNILFVEIAEQDRGLELNQTEQNPALED